MILQLFWGLSIISHDLYESTMLMSVKITGISVGSNNKFYVIVSYLCISDGSFSLLIKKLLIFQVKLHTFAN